MLFRRQPKNSSGADKDTVAQPVEVMPVSADKSDEPEIETIILEEIVLPKTLPQEAPDPPEEEPEAETPIAEELTLPEEELAEPVAEAAEEQEEPPAPEAMEFAWSAQPEEEASPEGEPDELPGTEAEEPTEGVVLQEGFFESMVLQELMSEDVQEPEADPVVQVNETNQMEELEMQDTDLTTMISRNTEIVGNISSRENVEVFGSVEGNISSDAVVKVYGTVNGKISCDMLIANNATIVGDIECKDTIELRSDTAVQGNISCASAMISGDVQGDINAETSITLSSSASIIGNISTKEFEVAKGAALNGLIEIKKGYTSQSSSDKKKDEEPLSIGIGSDSRTIHETTLSEHLLEESI